MKILVYEYFSALHPLSSAVTEGFAMLAALAGAFTKAGHQASTILHPGTGEVNLERSPGSPGVQKILPPGVFIHYGGEIEEALNNCESALVIAPEENGILEKVTVTVEKAGVRNIGSPSYSISKAANKYSSYLLLKKAGIRTPSTTLVKFGEASSEKTIPFTALPVIVKPVDGYGSKNVYLVKNSNDIKQALDLYGNEKKDFLVQEFIDGEHLSVSLIGGPDRTLALSLNSQEFSAYNPFTYIGGTVGIDHPCREKAFSVAVRTWEAMGGLRGPGGVDLICRNGEIYVIEVNPRPTSPFIALASYAGRTLAEIMLTEAGRFEGTPISPAPPLIFRV